MVKRVGQHRLLNILISQAVGGRQGPRCTAQRTCLMYPLPGNHLTDSPVLFFDGLPSAMAADTTHPEGDAPSAHSHLRQRPGEPQSPTDHHQKHRGGRKDTQKVSSGPCDSGWFPATAAGSLPQQTFHRRKPAEVSLDAVVLQARCCTVVTDRITLVTTW